VNFLISQEKIDINETCKAQILKVDFVFAINSYQVSSALKLFDYILKESQ
jgi:hypothetical protein